MTHDTRGTQVHKYLLRQYVDYIEVEAGELEWPPIQLWGISMALPKWLNDELHDAAQKHFSHL